MGTNPQNIPTITRINSAILAKPETNVLVWVARRLPRRLTSDMLTAVALSAAGIAAIGLVLTHFSLWWLTVVNASICLHWAGDSLDGTLARVRNVQRDRYGVFVDHACDTLSVLFIGFGLGASPLVDMRVALLMIIAFYALMIVVFLSSLANNEFRISYGAIGPTEARLGLVLVVTIVAVLRNPVVIVGKSAITILDIVGMFCVLIALSGGLYRGVSEWRRLAISDPLPQVPR